MMGFNVDIAVKRIYEPPAADDGCRILVDRLWPRGITREQAAIDERMPEIAPSPALRTWFSHRPERFMEFKLRYEQELASDPIRMERVEAIRRLALQQRVTLVYGAKDRMHNHAVVLRQWIKEKQG